MRVRTSLLDQAISYAARLVLDVTPALLLDIDDLPLPAIAGGRAGRGAWRGV